MGTITEKYVPCQEAALAAAKKALENARERAPVRPSYGEFVFQSRYCLAQSVSAMNPAQENLLELVPTATCHAKEAISCAAATPVSAMRPMSCIKTVFSLYAACDYLQWTKLKVAG